MQMLCFGRLRQLNIVGSALVQRFHILRVHNPVDISAQFQTIADCKHGIVQLQKTTVRFAQSELESVGSVAEGVLKLNIESQRAQVQDLLQLVVSSPQPPAAGQIHFQSEITLPPGREAFLRRIQMKGSFQIIGGEFRYPKSQFKMDELSVRASSRKKHLDLKQPPHVTAQVRTTYRAKEGTVTFSAITFDVPNASATATGTFNMLTKAIDLQGNLGMRATVSSAAGGIRSMLLLPLDPFYRKQGFGAVIPVRVEGTFGHPVFHASLRKHHGHRPEPRGTMSR
jgi:AsmA-like C-terminal region